jgi:integrase
LLIGAGRGGSSGGFQLAAEVPLKVLSEMMGHATIGITADIYADVIPNLQRDAAGKLERLLGRGGAGVNQ